MTTGPKAAGPDDEPARGSTPRLGFLLKHANLRYAELTERALRPLGIVPREWAALLSLDDQRSRSQAEIAQLLGIDRTTMVALVDELQEKGLVERRPHREDRRKNVVALTKAGRDIMRRGGQRVDECERAFLAVLDAPVAQELKQALHAVIASN